MDPVRSHTCHHYLHVSSRFIVYHASITMHNTLWTMLKYAIVSVNVETLRAHYKQTQCFISQQWLEWDYGWLWHCSEKEIGGWSRSLILNRRSRRRFCMDSSIHSTGAYFLGASSQRGLTPVFKLAYTAQVGWMASSVSKSLPIVDCIPSVLVCRTHHFLPSSGHNRCQYSFCLPT